MAFLKKGRMNIFIVGIGGCGMSGLGRLLAKQGHRVSGSDLKASVNLSSEDIRVYQGHEGSRIQNQDLVIYSGAIPSENPELLEAKRRNIPLAHRSEVLAELMNQKRAVAVTGMHGKTSTTGLLGKILSQALWDPTVAVGGDFHFLQGNARWGEGAWAVFEADESDGTLLHYQPEIALITNLESEHVDFFHNFDQVLEHFQKFVSNVKGRVVLNGDDPGCQALMRLCPGRPFVTYGFLEGVTVQGSLLKTESSGSTFSVTLPPNKNYTLKLSIPGVHQVSNALGAIAVAYCLGIDFLVIAQALEHFEGARRRFQLCGYCNGVAFLDDYAHHPTELRATLSTARLCYQGKILGVFQPHRYSRTSYFKEEFGRSFASLDHVVITDVYSGSEAPLPGVTGRLIYEEILKFGKPSAEYIADPLQLRKYLLENYSRYEAILILGAGDINHLSDEIMSYEKTGLETMGIRGKILKQESMMRHTTFRLGGPADWWVEPVDLEDLLEVQKFARSNGLPLFIIGNGSNVIVRDGGIRGVVVRLSAPYFKRFRVEGESLFVGSGLSVAELITVSLDAGLGGLENLKGIPGTVGGALHFNAGAYGSEIGDRVEFVLVLNPDGSLETLSQAKVGFEYRNASGLKGKMVLGVKFRLMSVSLREVRERIIQLKTERALRYPKLPNAGCIFKNPAEAYAGKLIDELGLKNLSVGGAMVSKEHGNFIINTGEAKASDVLELIERVRKRVQDSKNIRLENEVEVIGED